MNKVAVVTDTNSGLDPKEAERLGVFLIPMPFFIDGQMYYENVSITQEEFYERLRADASISTSMPAPGDVQDVWKKVLDSGYDELVYIPMSSGLSSSCSAAQMLADDFDGKVQVVDNQRISVTMYQSVLDALYLIGQGMNASEVKDKLEETKFESSIYISLQTLKYLKKGGRITPAAAAMGTILNIKPVLQIQGEKLDAYAKARGMKAARQTMIKAVQNDLDTRFAKLRGEGKMRIMGAYSGTDLEIVKDWTAEIQAAFPGEDIYMAQLPLSICCHIGDGALAVTTELDMTR